MKTKQINKFNLKIGDKINVYYKNGKLSSVAKVTRITDSSCFLSNYGGHRESWNTVNSAIIKGYYVIKK
jgi:uncharacterized protein with NRDE domain